MRECLLDRELDLIANRFLRKFPGRRFIEVNDNTLVLRGFPLPDDYSPDRVNLLIVTYGFPDLPPAGVHIPSNTPNLSQIAKRLDGHVIENLPTSLREHVEELAEHGWTWICYHYRDWVWRLNPNNLLSGDCLYKYVENVYAALSGGHK